MDMKTRNNAGRINRWAVLPAARKSANSNGGKLGNRKCQPKSQPMLKTTATAAISRTRGWANHAQAISVAVRTKTSGTMSYSLMTESRRKNTEPQYSATVRRETKHAYTNHTPN